MQQRNSNSDAKKCALPKVVSIIDPAFRGGKLDIPIEKTYATKGRDEWLSGKLRKDLSLCCLFQKGRCHAQDRCHQVHADKDYVAKLREEQKGVVSCCMHCHDTASESDAAQSFLARYMPTAKTVHITFSPNDQPNVLSIERIAFTEGLIQEFRDNGCRETNQVIQIPARRVCRLHAKACCKYGKDCKNVHVCCQLGEAVMAKGSFPQPATVKIVAPVKEVPAAVPTPKPLPSFTVPPSGPLCEDEAEMCVGRRVLSKSKSNCSTLDPVHLGESSGRLRAIVFDVMKVLEESGVTPSEVPSAKSEDTQRRGSKTSSVTDSPNTHAFKWDAWHPCFTPDAKVISPATVDKDAFFRMFA